MTQNFDISIVIVNYNVRNFVVECLESYKRSNLNGLKVEIWLVDNASIDGSVEIIREQYPEVKLIANKDNVGFSIANNQAIRKANGKYILLLNPDTVLEEDTLQVCYEYMESHDNVGALGVKMIDGAGQFLPESKRALPTAWNSFTKLIGLSSLLPNSKTFNGYALGHLSKDERHSIQVLCGAFMFMPKFVLDKVGLLDERFFMYGEDIDLSYRIIKDGFEVHYIPDTTIIHYKGESTKKGSLNYVKTFYNAMGLYVDKHYTGSGASIFGKILKIGIWARAGISVGKRLISNLLPLVIDSLLIVGLIYLFSEFWAAKYFKNEDYYKGTSLLWNIGLYSLIWITTAWIVGFYKKMKWTKTLQAVIIGTIAILGIYGLLDESYRTSRVIILAGTAISFVTLSFTAAIKKRLRPSSTPKNILIVASETRASIIHTQLQHSQISSNVLGLVYPDESQYDRKIYINNLAALPELSKVLKADEIIFSTEDMSTKQIMKTMINLDSRLSFKISGDESLNILGSKSKNSTGEIYDVDLNYNLSSEYHQHIKRVFDILVTIIFVLLFPITLLWYRLNILNWIKTVFSNFNGTMTWIGYNNAQRHNNLPTLPPSIYEVSDNLNYARHYGIWMDIESLLSNILNLENQ